MLFDPRLFFLLLILLVLVLVVLLLALEHSWSIWRGFGLKSHLLKNLHGRLSFGLVSFL